MTLSCFAVSEQLVHYRKLLSNSIAEFRVQAHFDFGWDFGETQVVITLEIPLSTALYAARLAKQNGAYTILTPAPAEPFPPGGFADVDLLVPNENEASTLLNEPPNLRDPSWLASRLQERFGLKHVVITLGEKGAYIADGDRTEAIAAFKVSAVETPGAGDCFTAGLAFGLYHRSSLAEAAAFGCLSAALSVTVPGSFPSFGTLTEIAEFAKANRFEIPAALRAFTSLSAASTGDDARDGVEESSCLKESIAEKTLRP